MREHHGSSCPQGRVGVPDMVGGWAVASVEVRNR